MKTSLLVPFYGALQELIQKWSEMKFPDITGYSVAATCGSLGFLNLLVVVRSITADEKQPSLDQGPFTSVTTRETWIVLSKSLPQTFLWIDDPLESPEFWHLRKQPAKVGLKTIEDMLRKEDESFQAAAFEHIKMLLGKLKEMKYGSIPIETADVTA